ncbi:hypothetical protein [Patulibacter sp.]|uniref:hypothetical protein n=1 Tax=Patulibacter sp. TaxID=1912859 RepID=UPI0027179600|nr:hypothetical protein [Patulibacter sp.]MDO9409500.1 hypothetical protein [Patulibacter sp.]
MQHENEQQDTATGRTGLGRLVPRRGTGRTRAVIVGTGILAFGIAPLTYAATGGSLTLGERNSANDETQIIATENAGPGAKGGYATRQSNLSATGGAAIYGCRSTAKTSATDEKNACLRVNNLSNGRAFEFRAGKGTVGGDISVANGGDGTKPFTTNATGVATGLNADRVDGKDADAIVKEAVDKAVAEALSKVPAAKSTRWVLVNAAGQIEAQSGGFAIRSTYGGTPAGASENVYIDSGEDLSNKGITATIALQNQVDQGGTALTNGKDVGPDTNPEFSGEITATRCAITGVVACAPAGANTNTHFVVSPRLSDGQPTSATTRKRFYVVISQ